MENNSLCNLGWLTHLVDLNVRPFVPVGYSVKEHKKGGILEIEELCLYFSKGAKTVRDVLSETEKERITNANFLDYLLLNNRLISTSWRKYSLLFSGTIYQNLNEEIFVRRLYLENELWRWNFCSLEEVFYKNFALVLLE